METLICLAFSVHLTSSVSHSLRYFYTAVSPAIHFPEYTAVGLVDEEQFVYYDSNIRKMIAKTDWIEKNVDTEYWMTETQKQQDTQEIFKKDFSILMERFNQTKGVHAVQWMYGCELHDDGTKRGYEQYGYDGEDFLSLDLNTLTWTAANDKAVITKFKWNINAGYSVSRKNYLENTCIEFLEKYVSYGRDTLERKVPPVVTLFQKDSSSSVVCHATGFFPRRVAVSWQKNGVGLQKKVDVRETLRNQDETFQKRTILRVSPEELDKNEYACVVQHSGLEKELVLRVAERRILNPDGALTGVVIGAIIGVLLLALICYQVLFFCRKKMKNGKGGRRQNTKDEKSMIASTSKSLQNSKTSNSESLPTSTYDSVTNSYYSVTSTSFLISTER